MQTKTCDIAKEVRTLRAALSVLAEQLEPFEEWRALCQLDERERSGDPLQSIDGVLVRGRLARQLAEKSRVWRAYVRIEDAIGELIGPDVTEPTLLTVSKPHEDPIRAVVAPVPVTVEVAASNEKTDIEDAPVPIDTPPPEPAIVQPAVPTVELTEAHQRLRVKVRAASVAIPMIVAAANTPREISKADVSAHEAQPPAVAATGGASERPEPLPKKILERIRPVHDLGSKSTLPSPEVTGAGITAIWGARAIDAPEPEVEIIHKVADRNSDEGGVPTVVAGIEPTVERAAKPAQPANVLSQQPHPSVATEPRDLAAEAAALEVAVIAPARIAAVEAAITQLADPEIVRWTAPLEVIESRITADAGKDGLSGRLPDIEGEDTDETVAVDEAEVEIVTSVQPVPESASASSPVAPLVRKNGVSSRLRPAAASAGDVAEGEDRIDPAEYAAYHLDVEEASVEIIVPANGASRLAG